jgi:hypothetical protein
VLAVHDNIEIREYKLMVVAQVTIQENRKEAMREGFRLLYDYISGNNIAMTAPVIEQQSKKIAMTAPIMQQAKNKAWVISFIMPYEYSLEMLPTSTNSKVILTQIPAKTFATIKFSGLASNENIAIHEKKLLAYLAQNNLKATSPPIYAFYNPPWTLPFLRRNEIMFEI